MTPKEHAIRLIEALDKARRSGNVVHEHELTEAAFDDAIAADRAARAAKFTPDAERFDTIIAAKEKEARLAEREACAQIADDHDTPANDTWREIAAAIRSRA